MTKVNLKTDVWFLLVVNLCMQYTKSIYRSKCADWKRITVYNLNLLQDAIEVLESLE